MFVLKGRQFFFHDIVILSVIASIIIQHAHYQLSSVSVFKLVPCGRSNETIMYQ